MKKKLLIITMLWQMVSMNIQAAGLGEVTSALKVLQSKLVTLSALLQGSQDEPLKNLADEIVKEYMQAKDKVTKEYDDAKDESAKRKVPLIPLSSNYSTSNEPHSFYDTEWCKKEETKQVFPNILFKIMRATKQHFLDVSELKTFTSYGSGFLEIEYLVLKALYSCGFTDIKIINIADLAYEKQDEATDPGSKQYESYQKTIAYFTTEVKKLFPNCEIHVWKSNKAHREACVVGDENENPAPKSDFVLMAFTWEVSSINTTGTDPNQHAIVNSSCAHDNALVAIVWEEVCIVELAYFENNKIPLHPDIVPDARIALDFGRKWKSFKKLTPDSFWGYMEFVKFKKENPELMKNPGIKSYIDTCEQSFEPIKNIGAIYSKYKAEQEAEKRVDLLKELTAAAKEEGIQLEGIDDPAHEE